MFNDSNLEQNDHTKIVSFILLLGQKINGIKNLNNLSGISEQNNLKFTEKFKSQPRILTTICQFGYLMLVSLSVSILECFHSSIEGAMHRSQRQAIVVTVVLLNRTKDKSLAKPSGFLFQG